MSRRQRPSRRLASSRAARRRRQFVPPERLPAPGRAETPDVEWATEVDYEELDEPSLAWEPD